jgi:hypothetical protein
MSVRRFTDEATTPLRQRGWPDALPPNGERDARPVEDLLDGLHDAALAEAAAALVDGDTHRRGVAAPGWPFTTPAGFADPYEPPHPADQQEQPSCTDFTKGETQPLVKSVHDPAGEPTSEPECDCGTRRFYALPNGNMVAHHVDGRTKACPKCGPRLRAEYAAGYAAVIGDGPAWQAPVAETDQPKLKAGIKRAGGEFLPIPAGPGERILVASVPFPGASPVTDLAATLAAFEAMPSDRRHVRASAGWQQAFMAWREEQHPTVEPDDGRVYLGSTSRPLAHVAMVARELGMLGPAAVSGDTLVLQPPADEVTWHRFCALIQLRVPRRSRAEDVAA